MTHDELLTKIDEIHKSCTAGGSDKDVPKSYNWPCYNLHSMAKALRAVIELHKPIVLNEGYVEIGEEPILTCECDPWNEYDHGYPCHTIQAIEKELK